MGREEIIAYCMTLRNAYKDIPFRDEKQIVISHKENRKVYAWFYEVREKEFVRFRCLKESGEKWIQTFPEFHMGFSHEEVCWLEIPIEIETLTQELIENLAGESYELTKPEKRRRSLAWYFM